MADITTVEEKLAEVTGLAQAAQGVIDKVAPMVSNQRLSNELDEMKSEAEETEDRCTELIDRREGSKTAILDKARETKQEATEMMKTYLGDGSDGLDGFEFMTMAEAGEVGHWEVLRELSERTGETELKQLADWATPIQERHLDQARQGSVALAAQEAV